MNENKLGEERRFFLLLNAAVKINLDPHRRDHTGDAPEACLKKCPYVFSPVRGRTGAMSRASQSQILPHPSASPKTRG